MSDPSRHTDLTTSPPPGSRGGAGPARASAVVILLHEQEDAETVAAALVAVDLSVGDLVEAGDTVYGVTTGFGHFAEVRIEPDQDCVLEALALRQR